MLASVSAICAMSGAHAQTADEGAAAPLGVEDIVVTARKRAEDVQSVPLSVSAVSGTALERRGIANVKELASVVPSLALVGQNSNRSAILQIRGIGSSGLNPGIEPDVGVYFDGAYQKQAATVLSTNLLDIEAIEVLRGPQGTLYGRNTPVGAVIVRSRAPTSTPEAMVKVGGGNLGTAYLQGYVGGGIAPDLAARLSFYGSRLSGYDHNITTDDRVNGSKQFGGRFRARWTPSSAFTADLILYYNRLSADCCVGDNVDPTGPRGIATPGFLTAIQAASGRPYTNLTAKDHVVDTAENPRERVRTFGASFAGEIEIGALSLNSITAYSGTRVDTPRGASMMQPVVAVNSTSAMPIDTYSQEFRLSNDAKERIAYQLGVYVFGETTDYDETRTTVRPTRVFADGTMVAPGLSDRFRFHQRTRSASAYGQATWTVTDALRFTGGGRYSRDRKRGSVSSVTTPGAPANFTASFPSYNRALRYKESKFTWLASAQYDVAPSVMFYGTVSTGWKSGGFNGRLASGTVPLVFNAENAKNYEVGIKSTFFDRRLLLNLSVYKLDVKGFQDSTLNPITQSGFIVGNAGDIHAKGVEMDIQARPIPQLLINVTGAYLSSHYGNYSAAPCFTGATPNGSRPNTCNLNGRTPAFSPKWRGSVGGEFTQPIGDNGLNAFLRGDLAYTSAQHVYAPLDPLSRQKAYALLNGRIGIEGNEQKWRVSLFAKNLTNKSYYTAVAPVSNGGFLSAGGRAGVTSLLGWTGAPRTYGLEASYKF
jgi:iron complex outermembrane receptor protein